MFVVGQTSPALSMTIKAIDQVNQNQNLDRPRALVIPHHPLHSK